MSSVVLGKVADVVSIKAKEDQITAPLITESVPVPTSTSQPVPTIIPYTISLINAPEELMEGDTVTFTWDVNGPSTIIHTTAIYYGTISSSGDLANHISPGDTQYTEKLKDFIQGDYSVPIRFVANEKYTTPGTYFFRAYALIDGKYYWTQERKLVVKQAPRHEIKVVNYPTTLSSGEKAAFTWDIYGPSATTGFTTIVVGKESKPGPLDVSITTTMTPYKIIVKDFTNGKFIVPLRFIGNASIAEPGVYYFRAIAYINDKNIWSDEYTITVH